MERSWKDWLVYLDVTNFLDKDYEKYYGRPGAERVFRLGVQRAFSNWGPQRGNSYRLIFCLILR